MAVSVNNLPSFRPVRQCGAVMACGCCSPLRARYKRLVDNIYPDYAEDGLVNANMQKLIYYAATRSV